MKTATRKPRSTARPTSRTRQGFWVAVSLLLVLGGAVYLYERDRKINARWEAERRARRVEREASLPPAEREARRIAREEAERVYAEQNR